jgi:hypothetical protein
MKSVLVSTRCENLTISPVTTPYLDLIVSFESCYGKLGLSDSGAPATTMKSVFVYKVRLNCPCLMLMVCPRRLPQYPLRLQFRGVCQLMPPCLFKSDVGKIPSSPSPKMIPFCMSLFTSIGVELLGSACLTPLGLKGNNAPYKKLFEGTCGFHHLPIEFFYLQCPLVFRLIPPYL